MLFCHIDSRVAGRKHATLRKDTGLTGLPSLAFLDGEGRVLVRVPTDERTVEGFRRAGARAERFVQLREASATGDLRAAAEFLRMQLEERQLDHHAALQRRRALSSSGMEDARDDAKPKPDARTLAIIDGMLIDLGVSTDLRKATQKRRYTLGPRFLEMWREGPKPTARVSRGFWFAILEWAEREKDAKVFAEALDGMRASLAVTDPGKSWVPGLLRRYETTLARLRRDRER